MNTLPNNSETAILKVYVILRTRRQAKDGKRLVGHSGGYPGFVGRTWLWIDDGITVSLLANAYDTAPGIVANSILGIIDQFGDASDKNRRKFEARFVNDYGVYEVVDTEKDATLKIAKGNHFSYFGELMKYEFDAKNKPSAMYRSGAKNYVSLDGNVRI